MEVPVEREAQDELSSLYFLRSFQLQPGQLLRIEAFSGKSTYDINVTVHPGEKVKSEAGSFHTVLCKPVLNFEIGRAHV